MRRRGVTPAVLLLALVATAAGCGARVSHEQRTLAEGGPRLATSANADTGGPQLSGPAVGTAGPGGPASEASNAGPGSSRGSTGSIGAAGAVQATGGATDIGVTADTVTIGNVSTLSGPVPGLFRGAVIGTQAAVAHQNSQGGIHGRRVKLEVRDDQLDAAQNKAVTVDLLDEVFAFAGSIGVYDDASAADVERSGLPDVVTALSGARRRIANNFNVAPAEEGGTQLAPFTYYSRQFPDEIEAVGTMFGDVPISRASQMANEAAGRSLGWKFIYSRGYSPTETDFTADVVRMRQLGVKLVFLAGSEPKTLARIANAMKQQNFDVPIATMNIGYDHSLLTLAPDALDGMLTTMQWSMFAGEDAEQVAEVKLLDDWVARVQPGFKPDLYALLGWASARYLFEALDEVGPNLTREAVNEALRTSGPFDANGLLAPADPGRKQPATCIVVTVMRNKRFERVEPKGPGYRCDLGGYFRSRS